MNGGQVTKSIIAVKIPVNYCISLSERTFDTQLANKIPFLALADIKLFGCL